jgi:hypothetical protein
MQWNGSRVRAGGGDKLAILKVGQRGLDRASRHARRGSDRLMGQPYGPMGLPGC